MHSQRYIHIFLVCVVITAVWAGRLVFAQQAQSSGPPSTARTIFDYKGELSLTDKQEHEIRDILTDLNKEIQINRAKLTILAFELDDLVNKKEGDPEQIKRKLKEECDLQMATRLADLMATRSINKRVLTPSQLEKWRKIQTAARTQQQQQQQ
jgi:hypothetical protein